MIWCIFLIYVVASHHRTANNVDFTKLDHQHFSLTILCISECALNFEIVHWKWLFDGRLLSHAILCICTCDLQNWYWFCRFDNSWSIYFQSGMHRCKVKLYRLLTWLFIWPLITSWRLEKFWLYKEVPYQLICSFTTCLMRNHYLRGILLLVHRMV